MGDEGLERPCRPRSAFQNRIDRPLRRVIPHHDDRESAIILVEAIILRRGFARLGNHTIFVGVDEDPSDPIGQPSIRIGEYPHERVRLLKRYGP